MSFLATPSLQPLRDGLLRALLKDFIELCKLAKKKKLLHSSVVFYFLTSSQFDHPKIDPIALPLRPGEVTHSFLPLCRCNHVFLVDCCVLFVVSRPPKPRSLLFFIFFIFCRLMPSHLAGNVVFSDVVRSWF